MEESKTKRNTGGIDMKETRKEKTERLENALLEYIEKNAKYTQKEIATTIPSAAMALVELWKII